MDKHLRPGIAAPLALALLASACSIGIREPRLHEPPLPPPPRRPVRAEGPPEVGGAGRPDRWKVAASGDRLAGEGQAYTVAREKKGEPRRHDVALADVALLESSSPETVSSAGLGLIVTTTVVLGGITGYCTVNPKGCFGSCPTFYVEGADGREPDRPQAEGFSEAIARVLEARDLDALEVDAPGRDGRRGRDAQRGAGDPRRAPRAPARGRAPAGRPGPRRARRPPPSRASAPVAGRVPRARGRLPGDPGLDRRERPRLDDGRAGPRDARGGGARLPRRPRPPGRRARRPADPPLDLPLLPDDGPRRPQRRGVPRDARARGPGGGTPRARHGAGPRGDRRGGGGGRRPWRAIGSFDEAGPIAGDRRVLPFEATGAGPLRVRLRLARGHWRLDSVAVAELGEPLVPVRLEPFSVERDGYRDDAARTRLREGERHLVTRPGDAYRLVFRLPRSERPSTSSSRARASTTSGCARVARRGGPGDGGPRVAAPARGPAAARPGLQGAGGAAGGGLLGQPVPKVRCPMRSPGSRVPAVALAALLAGGCAARSPEA